MSELGNGTRGRDVTDARGPGSDADLHAQSVLDARLGRAPRDVLEATVVLEAWMGRPARNAMSSANQLIRPDGPPLRALSNVDPFARSEQNSVIAEGLTLVLLIISIAAWATPIRRELGPQALAHAIRFALPVAVALQWGLRSRYLGRPHGLGILARDGIRFWVLLLVLIDGPLLAFCGGWGFVAAMLIPIWVGGTVLTRRGWGLTYAGVLVLGTVALDLRISTYAVLSTVTALTLVMCWLAVRKQEPQTPDARPGSFSRAAGAALIGGIVGALMIADPSLGLGVHGAHPAVALLPSVIGSYWGGYYLWHFYEEVPRGLRGTSLHQASRVTLSDPAMSIFIGAMARLVGGTVILSLVVVSLGGVLGGTDDVSVFLAFGLVATVSMLIGMLESLSLYQAALLAAATALVVELAWPEIVHGHAPGAALAAGAAVGTLLSLPVLLSRLIRSGRVVATTLWIQ